MGLFVCEVAAGRDEIKVGDQVRHSRCHQAEHCPSTVRCISCSTTIAQLSWSQDIECVDLVLVFKLKAL